MLNRYPYTNGHVMVAPYAHEAWFSDSSAETLSELIATVARAQRILVSHYRTDGLNVGVNFGSAAGAGVAGHYHVHVVPRWAGDTNFMTVAAGVRVVPEELGPTRRAPGAALRGGRAVTRDRGACARRTWPRPSPGSSRGSATSISDGGERRRPSPRSSPLTFLAGLSFQGRLYSIEQGQPLTILATFAVYGAGLLNIAARLFSENPGGAILATTYEYGCAYLLTAGLMNLLLVLDAWDIASGKKP